MLRSIQSKIVILFMLVMLSVFIVAGTLIVGNVTQFYYNDFMSQMDGSVFDREFEESLSDAVMSENVEEKITELLDAYYGKIGVDSYRNYALLDGKNGRYISGSSGVELTNIEATKNVLLALNGKKGNSVDLKSKYIDYAYPVVKDGKTGYVIYVYR